MIRGMAARFAEQEAARRAAVLDEAERFDRQSFDEMAALGFTALPWPEEDGGAGGGFVSFALVLQELSRVSASLGAALWAHLFLAAWPLVRFGSAEAKEAYLGSLIDGRLPSAGVLPGAAVGGSQLRVGVTAKRDGDSYLLEGQQKYVPGGAHGELFIIYAETAGEPGTSGRGRYNAFILEKNCPGLVIQPVVKKLGLRAAGMAHLSFEGCRIPKAHRLGGEGQGRAIARRASTGVRYGLAAVAAGIAQGALDAALGYAQERAQFGKPIAKHQAIAFLLADMKTAADAAGLLACQAAWREDEGLADEGTSALALSFAADAAMANGIHAVQVYGGYGYMKEYPVERCMRDAKTVQIFKELDLAASQPRTGRGRRRG